MARAKRTDRTDARRRHRAQQVSDVEGADDADEPVQPATEPRPARPRRMGRAPASATRAKAAASSTPPRVARPGFLASARAAYRPANVRQDLALLPRLLIHWSVLLSAAVALVGTVLYITAILDANPTSSTAAAPSDLGTIGYVGGTVFQLFTSPPPFGAALLIGFMVPRATYLVGLVYGAFTSVLVTIYALVVASRLGFADQALPYIIQAWVLGLLGTMFFTAGIAWYRRFLDLLNPNRGQRQSQKPQQGRGNAPRNRLSGSGR